MKALLSKWHKVGVSYTNGGTITFAVDGKIYSTRKVPQELTKDNQNSEVLLGSWLHDYVINGSIKSSQLQLTGVSIDKLAELTKQPNRL